MINGYLRSAVAASLWFIVVAEGADGWDDWDTQYRLPFGFKGVAYGKGRFVAVGWNGAIMTSTNALAWQAREGGRLDSLSSAAYGDGRFVVVGDQMGTDGYSTGMATILTSTDGSRWEPQTPDGIGALTAVAYGNGIFVAVGPSALATSTNGIAWTRGDGSKVLHSGSLKFGGGVFVAMGERLTSSSDGVNWIPRKFLATGLTGLVYGKGIFLVGSETGQLWESADGAVWTAKRTNPMGSEAGSRLKALAFANGVFMASGERCCSTSGFVSVFAHSADGEIWTTGDANFTLHAAEFAAGHPVVGVGDGIYTAVDGKIWTARVKIRPSTNIRDVARGDGLFVAVGAEGAYGFSPPAQVLVLTSEDGSHWVRREIGVEGELLSVAHGAGTFVGVGEAGQILTSRDGITWQAVPSGTNDRLNEVQFVNGLFVAVGGNFLAGAARYVILTSADGISWSKRLSGPGGALDSIAYGNGVTLATGGILDLGRGVSSNIIFKSLDGVTWIQQPSQPGNILRVTFGNGMFVGVRWYDSVLRSKDGAVWTSHTNGSSVAGATPFYSPMMNVSYGNGRFLASGWNRNWFSSADGINWTKKAFAFSGPYYASGLDFAAEAFWLASSSGVIMKSGTVRPPTEVGISSEIEGFRIIRRSEAGIAFDLPVFYSIERTLLDGTKIRGGPISSVIPEGQVSVFVAVAPREYAEALATLLPSEGYAIGTSGSAIHRLVDGGLAPRFRSFGSRVEPDGMINWVLDSQSGATVLIETSPDLQTWNALLAATNSSGVIEIPDPVGRNRTRRFYRAKLLGR